MENVEDNLMPGDRVLVFDSSLFKNDMETPLSVTMKPATIISRYGSLEVHYHSGYSFGPFPDLCDVKFDHKENISKAHFTSGLVRIPSDNEMYPSG